MPNLALLFLVRPKPDDLLLHSHRNLRDNFVSANCHPILMQVKLLMLKMK